MPLSSLLVFFPLATEIIFKESHPHFLNRFRPVHNRAGIEIHIPLHPIVERRVRGHFDAGSRFATIHAPRPVVNTPTLQPPDTSPVMLIGS